MVHYNMEPVETERDLPKFCPACGRTLRPFRERTGFDARTGTPRFAIGARCAGWFGQRHYNEPGYVVSPRPVYQDE